MREHELDLNVRFEILTKVNSMQLPRSLCRVICGSYKRFCVKCCLHFYPEDRGSRLFRNADNRLLDYTPSQHVRSQNLLSNGQGKRHAMS